MSTTTATGRLAGRIATPGRGAVVVLAAALLVVVGAALGVLVGPVPIPAGAVLRDLADRLPFISVDSGLTPTERTILWDLRMPRVVLGLLVGGMLALGGAAYQGAFRNPLADPYLLGVAGGAGLGATIAITIAPGMRLLGITALPAMAFAGATGAVALTYLLGRSAGGRDATSLILAGVAVAAFLTALQTFVQQQHTDTLREVYDWILGRLSTAGWGDVRMVLPYIALSVAVVLAHGRVLNVLALGDDGARVLGVPAGTARLVIVGAVTLGTAAAVAVSGLIGFVGIIVPHTIRLLGASGGRSFLPATLLAGAGFLVIADLCARTVLAPAEIPIGVVTALAGAPFFAVVLRMARSAS